MGKTIYLSDIDSLNRFMKLYNSIPDEQFPTLIITNSCFGWTISVTITKSKYEMSINTGGKELDTAFTRAYLRLKELLQEESDKDSL